MNIGILGAGGIGSTMAKTLDRMDDVTAYAVASRSKAKAEAFAQEYGVEKAYGSYEEMVKDESVELVYIATPHSHHYEHAKLCLEHGKHVLCEKAFTVNVKQAKEIMALAKSKNLLITEAIWPRYMPSRKMINDLLAAGKIGTPNMLTANLGYLVADRDRIKDPKLAGGALLDLGVYPLNFALMAFGTDIKSMSSTAVMSESGVDLQNSMVLEYNDGKMAVLNSTALALTDRRGVISGDNGYMIIENVNNCECIRIFNLNRKEVETYPVPRQISGYEYEVQACVRAIRAGETECVEMPHSETIRVMEIMDTFRAQWGMVYPMEEI